MPGRRRRKGEGVGGKDGEKEREVRKREGEEDRGREGRAQGAERKQAMVKGRRAFPWG